MEFFHGAKAVRLRSHQNKYLIAEDDEETVRQSNNGSSRNARWTVEFIESKPNSIRLKSCHTWKYLSASDDPFLLGWTGKRIVQASPRMKNDASVEWEPVRDRGLVKLRSGKGKGMFLRANGSLPPWRYSVTHDVPSRTATQDWILWEVEILENDHSHEIVKPEIVVEVLSKKDDLKIVDPSDGDDYVEEEERESSGSSESAAVDHRVTVPSSPGSARSVVSTASSKLQDVEPIARVSSIALDKGASLVSKKSSRVPPLVQNVIAADSAQSSRHSNSFSSLKSMLDDAQKLLDGNEAVEEKPSVTTIPTKKPTSLEVRMAKQTLKDVKDLDFRSIYSSETRLRKLLNAISILYNSNDGRLYHQSNLLDLQLHIGTLRDEYFSASDDLSQHAAVSADKSTVKLDFQKDVAKARELETRDEQCNSKLSAAYAKRFELLRQLEEVEKEIEENENAKAENAAEIDQLISLIGQKSQVLKEMESKEKSLQYKKYLAEKKIKQVEEDWVKIKDAVSDL